ncbi:hypothetical protein GCM10020331_071210 [Ectobacillus funiculus]
MLCMLMVQKVGIQIAHSGRKAEHIHTPVAPSAIRFNERYGVPRELTTDEVKQLVEKNFAMESDVRCRLVLIQ